MAKNYAGKEPKTIRLRERLPLKWKQSIESAYKLSEKISRGQKKKFRK